MFERFREIQQKKSEGNESNYGFTLIELLIVIIVLGILAAIVVLSLGGVTGESKAAACNAEAHTVAIADDAYQADPANNNTWAGSIAALTAAPGYLRTAPSDDGYVMTITAGTTDVAQVSVAGGPVVAYTDPTNGCDSLG